MTNITKLQFGAVIILALLSLALILSQKAAPDNTQLFSLKRVQEKVYLKLRNSPQDRLDYMSFLLDRRLEELRDQVNRESYGYILPSASRYSSLAGQITEMVMVNNMQDRAKMIIDQFNNHKKVLQEIYVIYPKNTDNVEYKYIEDDINYLKIYLDKLSNFFKAEKA